MKRSVPSKKYYQHFKLLTHFPFWRKYLQWSYQNCIKNFSTLNYTPDFKKKNFSCLLCGTSGEITTDEFIRFVLEKNISPKITIIDYGNEQIKAVKKLVDNDYKDLNMHVKKMDALNLSLHFPKASFDWIETDGLLAYFDDISLSKLLAAWQSVLKPDGFITIRDFGSNSRIEDIIDKIRIYAGMLTFGATVYKHTSIGLKNLFASSGFKYVEEKTPIFFCNRYSLVKNNKTPITKFIIRPAHKDEQIQIRSMIRAEHLYPFNVHWENFLIAQEKNQIIGIGQVKPYSNAQELGSLVVLNSKRKCGVSEAIINALIARRSGPLFLFCKQYHEPYYAKFGFRRVFFSDIPNPLKMKYSISWILTNMFHNKQIVMKRL